MRRIKVKKSLSRILSCFVLLCSLSYLGGAVGSIFLGTLLGIKGASASEGNGESSKNKDIDKLDADIRTLYLIIKEDFTSNQQNIQELLVLLEKRKGFSTPPHLLRVQIKQINEFLTELPEALKTVFPASKKVFHLSGKNDSLAIQLYEALFSNLKDELFTKVFDITKKAVFTTTYQYFKQNPLVLGDMCNSIIDNNESGMVRRLGAQFCGLLNPSSPALINNVLSVILNAVYLPLKQSFSRNYDAKKENRFLLNRDIVLNQQVTNENFPALSKIIKTHEKLRKKSSSNNSSFMSNVFGRSGLAKSPLPNTPSVDTSGKVSDSTLKAAGQAVKKVSEKLKSTGGTLSNVFAKGLIAIKHNILSGTRSRSSSNASNHVNENEIELMDLASSYDSYDDSASLDENTDADTFGDTYVENDGNLYPNYLDQNNLDHDYLNTSTETHPFDLKDLEYVDVKSDISEEGDDSTNYFKFFVEAFQKEWHINNMPADPTLIFTCMKATFKNMIDDFLDNEEIYDAFVRHLTTSVITRAENTISQPLENGFNLNRIIGDTTGFLTRIVPQILQQQVQEAGENFQYASSRLSANVANAAHTYLIKILSDYGISQKTMIKSSLHTMVDVMFDKFLNSLDVIFIHPHTAEAQQNNEDHREFYTYGEDDSARDSARDLPQQNPTGAPPTNSQSRDSQAGDAIQNALNEWSRQSFNLWSDFYAQNWDNLQSQN